MFNEAYPEDCPSREAEVTVNWHEDVDGYEVYCQYTTDSVPDIDLACNETLEFDSDDEWFQSIWEETSITSQSSNSDPLSLTKSSTLDSGLIISPSQLEYEDPPRKKHCKESSTETLSSESQKQDPLKKTSRNLPSCQLLRPPCDDHTRNDSQDEGDCFPCDTDNESLATRTRDQNDKSGRDWCVEKGYPEQDRVVSEADLIKHGHCQTDDESHSQEVPDLNSTHPDNIVYGSGTSSDQQTDSESENDSDLLYASQFSVVNSEDGDEQRELLSCEAGDHVVPCAIIEE